MKQKLQCINQVFVQRLINKIKDIIFYTNRKSYIIKINYKNNKIEKSRSFFYAYELSLG